MSRHQWLGSVLVLGLTGAPALAQDPKAAPAPVPVSVSVSVPVTPETQVQLALLSNPITAPYRIAVTPRNGRLVLSGRVGTHLIHDVAVRTAMYATNSPIGDDLTIDTLEAYRVAALASAPPAWGPRGGRWLGPSLGLLPSNLGAFPSLYPPPLFGRVDDPFFGFEPPLLSYAPWFGATVSRLPNGAVVTNPPPARAGALPPVNDEAPGAAATPRPDPAPVTGMPRIRFGPDGIVELSGTVATAADRDALVRECMKIPGVVQLFNNVKIGRLEAPAVADAGAGAAPPRPMPPPAPAPAADRGAVPRPDEAGPAPRPGLAVDAGDLTGRITDAFTRRPALADLAIRITARDGVASLTGSVPTLYEAMLAFRAVQQVPGIREVIDRLEFAMPDDEHRNPLVTKGRPEDVEPYLETQLRRQLADLAHVDSVRLRGDTLEIKGSLTNEDDRPRLDASLRTMPILRGFRVAPAFTVD